MELLYCFEDPYVKCKSIQNSALMHHNIEHYCSITFNFCQQKNISFYILSNTFLAQLHSNDIYVTNFNALKEFELIFV